MTSDAPRQMYWLAAVAIAMRELGGKAPLPAIYKKVKSLKKDLPQTGKML